MEEYTTDAVWADESGLFTPDESGLIIEVAQAYFSITHWRSTTREKDDKHTYATPGPSRGSGSRWRSQDHSSTSATYDAEDHCSPTCEAQNPDAEDKRTPATNVNT
ncbi:hypothetical protein MTO96_039997 [Rhipicephalus appendiculatus]